MTNQMCFGVAALTKALKAAQLFENKKAPECAVVVLRGGGVAQEVELIVTDGAEVMVYALPYSVPEGGSVEEKHTICFPVAEVRGILNLLTGKAGLACVGSLRSGEDEKVTVTAGESSVSFSRSGASPARYERLESMADDLMDASGDSSRRVSVGGVSMNSSAIRRCSKLFGAHRMSFCFFRWGSGGHESFVMRVSGDPENIQFFSLATALSEES